MTRPTHQYPQKAPSTGGKTFYGSLCDLLCWMLKLWELLLAAIRDVWVWPSVQSFWCARFAWKHTGSNLYMKIWGCCLHVFSFHYAVEQPFRFSGFRKIIFCQAFPGIHCWRMSKYSVLYRVDKTLRAKSKAEQVQRRPTTNALSIQSE